MKNWKNSRGILINNRNNQSLQNEFVNIKNIFHYDTNKYLLKDIKLKRVVNLEFSNIQYVNKYNSNKYFNWHNM